LHFSSFSSPMGLWSLGHNNSHWANLYGFPRIFYLILAQLEQGWGSVLNSNSIFIPLLPWFTSDLGCRNECWECWRLTTEEKLAVGGAVRENVGPKGQKQTGKQGNGGRTVGESWKLRLDIQ
jgi:hypothetical protein